MDIKYEAKALRAIPSMIIAPCGARNSTRPAKEQLRCKKNLVGGM